MRAFGGLTCSQLHPLLHAAACLPTSPAAHESAARTLPHSAHPSGHAHRTRRLVALPWQHQPAGAQAVVVRGAAGRYWGRHQRVRQPQVRRREQDSLQELHAPRVHDAGWCEHAPRACLPAAPSDGVRAPAVLKNALVRANSPGATCRDARTEKTRMLVAVLWPCVRRTTPRRCRRTPRLASRSSSRCGTPRHAATRARAFVHVHALRVCRRCIAPQWRAGLPASRHGMQIVLLHMPLLLHIRRVIVLTIRCGQRTRPSRTRRRTRAQRRQRATPRTAPPRVRRSRLCGRACVRGRMTLLAPSGTTPAQLRRT